MLSQHDNIAINASIYQQVIVRVVRHSHFLKLCKTADGRVPSLHTPEIMCATACDVSL